MKTTRLEAFSDGVIAIIITIMVLELKVPHGAGFHALRPLIPIFASYVMSFVYVGIYWNNHHHLLHATDKVDGAVLWCNLHMMFWLSLIPFATAWMQETEFASLATAVYGCVLLACALAWLLLRAAILRCPGQNERLRVAIGRDRKGKVSLALYAAAIPVAYFHTALSLTLYVIVALMWLIPDRRIENIENEAR
jgi:uncharacterized membrane protein